MSATETTARVPPSVRTSPRSRSIWLWQLSLAAVIVILTLAIVVLAPEQIAAPTTAAGIALILVFTVMALILPWDRIGRATIAVLPLADILAIGLIAYGDDLRFGYLSVFPLAWLASHFRSAGSSSRSGSSRRSSWRMP
ncbi:hypothetical protein [Microbacterium lacticum]